MPNVSVLAVVLIVLVTVVVVAVAGLIIDHTGE
jgi:hypothetical protein